MNKPQPEIKKILHWNECIKYLEEKYDFQHRDYNYKFRDFNKLYDEICKREGVDRADLEEDLSKADNTDPEVIRKLKVRKKINRMHELESPVYLDFWHWCCDHFEIHNGCTIYFDTELLDEDYSYNDVTYKKHPQHGRDGSHDGQWIKKIIGYILDEFGEGKYKECTFEVYW